MTARLVMLRNRIMAEVHTIRPLTAPELRVTLASTALSQRRDKGHRSAAATGGFVCARLASWPSPSRRRARRTLGPAESISSRLIADAGPLSKSVLLILLLFSAVSWGIILYKIWQYRARRARHRDVPPGLPQEHQVFRGAVDLRERRRRVRWSASSRRATPSSTRSSGSPGKGRSRRRIQAAGRRGASYLEKPRRGRPGAAARDRAPK